MAFDDGNVSAVVRVGATVRRVPGPWTRTIHALLRHLERVGFPGAPRAVGFDEQGREVLTFVAGETHPSPLVSFGSDAGLAAVARLLRRYHDATTTFVAPHDATWRFQTGAPATGDVVCHNDIAPWNTVVADGRPSAFIDWDFAAPGPRSWDIAHALWRFVPLYDDAQFGTPTEQARRMRLFCDAYGLEDRRGLLDLIARRQHVLYNSVVAWAAAGDPAFAVMCRDGHTQGILSDLAYVRRHRAEFEREVGPGPGGP
jgi:hypothetical protein